VETLIPYATVISRSKKATGKTGGAGIVLTVSVASFFADSG